MKKALLLVVVADELEERAMAIVREEGIAAVTALAARGIGFPEHMTFFGLTYRGLEKVLMCVTDRDTAVRTADRLNRELDLLAPFQGLAMSLDIGRAEGGGVAAPERKGAPRRHAGSGH